MPKTQAFNNHLDQYEYWFTKNKWIYLSELETIRRVLPASGKGLEIGIGSGIFAEPLGIPEGIDPSPIMREKARERGLTVYDGVAEDLPYADSSIDFALMVTTICFVDDIPLSISEAWRILKQNGTLVIAFVDKDSLIGKQYQAHKEESLFYKEAVFVSTDELIYTLSEQGFEMGEIWQNIFCSLDEVCNIQQPEKGYGKGSFVVISAHKKEGFGR